MRRRLLTSAAVLAACCLAAAAPGRVAAQSLWIPRDVDSAVMLEVLRPSLEGIDADIPSCAVFLSARTALSPRTALVAQLPYAREEGRYRGYSYYYPYYFEPYYYPYYYRPESRGSAVGNPYIGLESRPRSTPFFWELGVRLPLTPRDGWAARSVGAFSDATRADAFFTHVTPIQVAFNISERAASGLEYRLRLSPVLDVANETNVTTDAFMIYSWQIGYRGSHARIGSALSGRARLSGARGNLGSRALDQAELHADFLSGSVRPGLDLHLPLGSWGDAVPVVLGVSLTCVP